MGTKIYLKYNDIKGAVTEAGHKDWVELDSFNLRASRSVSQDTGTSRRSVSSPSISAISISKKMSMCSPQIFQESLSGIPATKCIIHFVNDTGNVFNEYDLTGAVISAYETSATGNGEEPSEHMQIHFTAIKKTHTHTTPEGKSGSPFSVGYDLQLAKKI